MTSSRKHVSSGSTFEEDFAYSRAVVEGDQCWLSGTTGYDYSTMTISDDPRTQYDQCFKNVNDALTREGFCMEDIVRVEYIVTDRASFLKAQPVIKHWMDPVRPAATMWIAKLFDEKMIFEITVFAKKRKSVA
eukprot:Clim_evm21s169 gene=Clim_evmTU21s169